MSPPTKEVVAARVTSGEKAEIKEAARTVGVSMSRFVREAARERVARTLENGGDSREGTN